MTPVNSYQARLTVNNPPRITIKKSPNNQNVIFGTTNLPTLSVVTNNIQNAQLNYQWYQSSDTSSSSIGWKKIINATSSSYTVPNSELVANTKKQYYVEVGGVLNGVVLESINSNAITVNVNLPKISINKEPTDKTINLWESNLATFSAVASISDSKAILNYQWYQNGNLIHGATKSSYTVPRSELVAGATKSYYVRGWWNP